MKFERTFSLKTLFEGFDVKIFGEAEGVEGINEIHRVEKGDLCFVDHPKYYEKTLSSAATFILINKEMDVPEGKSLIVCEDPFYIFNSIAARYTTDHTIESIRSRDSFPEVTIEPGVVIHPGAQIGKGSYIHANTVIGPNVKIGENVIIHANASIGIDAFYFQYKNGKRTKWHSIGSVSIEDDVEIGANCTISRGVTSATIIGRGSKLDAQVHLGHGVIIGEHCLIAAQAGISGKSIIGDHTIIYGQAGIAQNVKIGKQTIIAAKAGVPKDLEGGQTYFGIPARQMKEFYREYISLKKLPDIIKLWKNRS